MSLPSSAPEPAAPSLEFGVLGPVRMRVAGEQVALGGAGQRALLALLVSESNQVVGTDRIVDVLWGEQPPATARTIVHGYVSKLRAIIGRHVADGEDRPVAIVTEAPGYKLVVERWAVDVERARDLLAQARGRPARVRAELLSVACALWRGDALCDLPSPPATSRLTDLRLAVLSERIEADLDLGRDAEVVGELRELLVRHPYFERAVAQLMRALYRCGRRAEALECYREFRKRATGELGIDPGPQLSRLYERVLRDEPGLLGPGAARPLVAPAELPPVDAGFGGRHTELERLDGLLTEPAPHGSATVAVISGQAGVGKTTLAVHWGHAVAGEFAGGQLFAPLGGFDPRRDPVPTQRVLGRFLLALGVRPADIPDDLTDRAALYRSLLAGRRVLVVLDDARDSEQVRQLLPGSGGSVVLITSRNGLDGLVARGGPRSLPIGVFSENDAAEVIATAGLGLPEHDSRRLAELCGYLPLALRVVTAKLAGAPKSRVEQVLCELSDERGRLSALRVEGDDTSVRAALDVSYRTLPSAAADAFVLLGVLPGPSIDPHGLAALQDTSPSYAVAVMLQLTAVSLFSEIAPARFGPHDLVRLYARERAAALDRTRREAALRRLLHYYLVMADRARRQLRPAIDGLDIVAQYGERDGPLMDTPQRALDWFAAEWPNLVAAQHTAAVTGMHRQAWQLARLGHVYRMMRPVRDDWKPIIERGMASSKAAGDRAGEVLTLICASSFHVTFDEVGEMVAYARQALAIAEASRCERLRLLSMSQLVGVLAAARRYEEALTLGEHLVQLARAVGDSVLESRALSNMAQAEMEFGRVGDAIAHQREAMELDQLAADDGLAAHSAANLAELEVLDGDLEAAGRHARYAVRVATEQELTFTEAFARQVLGAVLGRRADAAGAREQLVRSLRLFQEVDSPRVDQVRDALERLPEPGASA